ncbi:hypothetical protein TCE0_041f13781 [Talaromyces pinophilus]|uniref:Major facilitator superfamily (MFS) profile domain-containing protein n=1 Tax=Talaromyces pinophilus TaxID=128442 RepID=A0A6V8HGI4_TALPI|nr:hypothetical protein TCE0_041f13781 [Talaromyces pinophilus]
MSGKSELPVDGRYVSSSSENSDQEYAGTKTALGSDTLEALRNRVSGGDATFDQTEDLRYYKPIDTYEGIHRWDPEFEWEEWEEKKIVRKIDLRICTFACLTFFALQLDRGNLVQATSDNMLGDLGLTTNNYNTGNTIFLVCFLFAELPSQLISKRLGPDRWIPIQMVCWSLIASCQAFLTGRSTFYATRALLGLFEGGFIPDTILFLSYWYKSKELPIRLSFFWASYELTSIIGAFLAFGFLHIHTDTGKGQWRYLFALEGLITGVIGIFAAFYMPASPTQTSGGLRGKVLPRHKSAWARYVLLILLIGSPYMHAAVVAMTSRNSGSVRTRTVASAVYNMAVQTSGIIGSNIYRSNDAPLYLRGNKVLIGIASLSLFLFLFAKVYYDLKNYYRARKWNAMSSAERDAHLAANKDSGNKRLDFRFIS